MDGPRKGSGSGRESHLLRHGNSLIRVSANRLADAKNVRFDSCKESDLISEEKESGVEPSLTDSLAQPSDLNGSPVEEILSETTVETETQEDNHDNP